MENPPRVSDSDIGRWYGLSVEECNGSIELCIHVYQPAVLAVRKDVPRLAQDLLFDKDLTRGRGRDRAFLGEERGDYLVCKASLSSHHGLKKISDDVSDLLNLLNRVPKRGLHRLQRDPNHTQLMTIALGYDESRAERAMLAGYVSPLFVGWMGEHGRSDFDAVSELMWRVRNELAMFPIDRNEDGNRFGGIRAYSFGTGDFALTTARQESRITTKVESVHGMPAGGRVIVTDGIRSRLQQLTLLAGLAALHELARKDLDL